MLSPKQRTILEAVRVRGTLTLDEAVGLVGGNVFTNERFHVGTVLARMVKRGLIVRKKPGIFELPPAEEPRLEHYRGVATPAFLVLA